jgi:CHAT domain-containing protein
LGRTSRDTELNWKFYHRSIPAMLLVFALSAGADEIADESYDLAAAKLPPRSINDVTRMLVEHRQDDGLLRRLNETADAPDPDRETTGRSELFRFYWQRGRAAGELGRIGQQIADLRLAVEYAATGSSELARAMRHLGQAERLGGNYLAARHYLLAAIKQIPASGTGQLTGAYGQLVSLASQIGDFELARDNLAQLESVLNGLRSSKGWAKNSQGWLSAYDKARGDYFAMIGKPVEAEGAYRKALRENHASRERVIARQEQGDGGPSIEDKQQGAEGIERALSSVLLAQGKLVEAEWVARQALEHTLKRAGRSSPDTARGLRNLARIVSEQGRYAESAKLAETAIELLLSAGAAPNSLTVIGALRGSLSAQVALGNDGAALQIFERIKAATMANPAAVDQLERGDLDVVQAFLRTGRYQAAANMASGMLARLRQQQGEDSLRVAEVRAFHAVALADGGATGPALEAFRKSLPALIERSRNDIDAENGSARHQQRLVFVLERYVRLLFDMQRDGSVPPNLDAAGEAFTMADLARGSSVQRALSRSAARAAIKDPALAELARQEQDTQRRINSLNELLSQLLSAPVAQQLPTIQARLRQDIDTLSQDRRRLKTEIGQRFPDYARLVDPPAAGLVESGKLLQRDEVLVAWYFGDRASHAWSVAPDGRLRFVELPIRRSELATRVQRLRRALNSEAATIDQIPPFEVAVAQSLYASLLAPVEDMLVGAKTLLAVPHAELAELPLALLVTAPTTQPGPGQGFVGYRSVPWLMRKMAVAQLPSVIALASLRRHAVVARERLPFIGFGDPYFSEEQARQASRPAVQQSVAMRGVPVRLRNLPKGQGVDSAELALLPRLPDTAEEIRSVGAALGAVPDRDIFLHEAASEKNLFAADLANRRVVMFATHGLVPGELDGLSQPALALSAPGVTGSGDGLLTQEEILTLRLNADWVVLSACNTAAGEGEGSEAVSGLGRAFFYAGARALLVSNWPVETEASRALMIDLFSRQSADARLGKAEALRQAMAAMIDGAGKIDAKTGKPLYSYAHPLFWAPFVLIGD